MQGFRAFAFMKGKSRYIYLGRSVGVFFDLGNTVVDLQGKLVMFVGDRTPTRDPTPVIFATKKKAWEWVTKVVAIDPGALKVVHNNRGNPAKLWVPGFGQMMGEISVPRLLALPQVLAKLLQGKGQCLPHVFRAVLANLKCDLASAFTVRHTDFQ